MNGVKALAVAGCVAVVSLIWISLDSDFEDAPEKDLVSQEDSFSPSTPSNSGSAPASVPNDDDSLNPGQTKPAPPTSKSTEPEYPPKSASAVTTPDLDVEFEEKLERVDQWMNIQHADIEQLNALSEELKQRDSEMDRRIQEMDAQLGLSESDFEKQYPGFSPN